MGAIGGQLSGGIVTVTGLSSPVIDKLPMPLANTEYDYLFSSNTKQIILYNNSDAIIEYSYISGGETFPLYPKGFRKIENLYLTSDISLYFKSVKIAQEIKLEFWS